MSEKEYDRAEFHKRLSQSKKDGSLEKSKWSVTLSNGEVINYYQVGGKGTIDNFKLISYLNTEDDGFNEGLDGDGLIHFSHTGTYPKDINDPVSVMLAIWKVYNDYTPFKYSGNYPDISRFTTLPDGMVE